MKPIHTLTWAVSAPILLFAGASQALGIAELTDPGCNGGFVLDGSGYIKCAASATVVPICAPSIAPSTGLTAGNTATISANCPSATSWAWTPDIGNVSSKSISLTSGTHTYSVIASNSAGSGASSSVQFTVADSPPSGGGSDSACRSNYVMPPNTTIVRMTGVDFYAGRNFDDVFDNKNKFDSKSDAGQIKALEFTNDAFKWGNIDGTGGNYGQTYKDWSISACPGDFSTTLSELPAKCRKFKALGVTLTYHATDSTQGCVVPVGQKMYLNIRANDLKSSAGYVLTNSVIYNLP